MTHMEVTNTILEYFISRDIKTILDVSIDEEDNSPQIQININITGDENRLAFFYSLTDEAIYFSDIYELCTPITEAEFKKFKERNIHKMNPFIDIIKADNSNNEIHLFGELKPEDFNILILDKLIYLYNHSEVIKELKALSNTIKGE